MPFHRLTVPSYFGGLPGGYDYANNALVGTPAAADGAKAGGTNAGTYFVAFGEDATSLNANRGMKALAENTDFIDNLLRRDLAMSIRTSAAAGGPGVNNVVLGANTFLGTGGTTNDTTGLTPFFKITDDQDNDVLDGSGLVIVPLSLTLTLPDAIGVGFSQNTVTLNFSAQVPAGRNFRVYYATRTNLATMPQDVFTNIRIRSAQEVPFETEQLLQSLHGSTLAWDAPWTSTIWELSRSGLDDRYRRSTVAGGTAPPGFPTALALNTAGSGSWFHRDGAGVTGYSNANLNGVTGYNVASSDWLEGAIFGAMSRDYGVSASVGGNIVRAGATTTGFAFLGSRRFTNSDAESLNLQAPGFASFFHGDSIEVNGGTPDATFRTWLPVGTTVTFDGTGLGCTVSGAAYVAKNFFMGSDPESAIAVGYDLIELDFGGGVTKTFVFGAITGPQAFNLLNKDSSFPNFTNGGTATVIRWIRTSMGMFEDSPAFRAKATGGGYGSIGQFGLLVAQPPSMSNDVTKLARSPRTAAFFGPDKLFSTSVIDWGGFDVGTHTYELNASLYADGSIGSNGSVSFVGTGYIGGAVAFGSTANVTGLLSTAAIVSTSSVTALGLVANYVHQTAHVPATPGPTVAHTLDSGGGLRLVDPTGSGTLTVNITGCPAAAGDGGHTVVRSFITVRRSTNNLTAIAITLDGGNVLNVSSTSDLTLSSVTTSSVDVFELLFIDGQCFLQVSRYPG